MDTVLFVKAYPKVNIALKVHEKKGNFHEISSRFALVLHELYDEMFFYVSPKNTSFIIPFCGSFASYAEEGCLHPNLTFHLSSNFSIPLETNLIYKAYKVLLQNVEISHSSLPKDVVINVLVKKRIPVGGGLGGGSLNAAIALLALNTLLGLRCDLETLLKCANKIGSDVAFFVYMYAQGENYIAPYFVNSFTILTYTDLNVLVDFYKNIDSLKNKDVKALCYTSANVFGIGNIIEPFYEEYMPICIHCNDIMCDTGAVYREFARLRAIGGMGDNLFGEFAGNDLLFDFTKNSQLLLEQYSLIELNDLYIPACNLYPLQTVEHALEQENGRVYFSGSGSSFFSVLD